MSTPPLPVRLVLAIVVVALLSVVVGVVPLLSVVVVVGLLAGWVARAGLVVVDLSVGLVAIGFSWARRAVVTSGYVNDCRAAIIAERMPGQAGPSAMARWSASCR